MSQDGRTTTNMSQARICQRRTINVSMYTLCSRVTSSTRLHPFQFALRGNHGRRLVSSSIQTGLEIAVHAHTPACCTTSSRICPMTPTSQVKGRIGKIAMSCLGDSPTDHKSLHPPRFMEFHRPPHLAS
ncbi:hypothetical protein SMAC4_13336 [Sordaria macrospora]|uniref:uncharacterized protein n=1 Tax=Sordaria macrospora TaxID=5147 RepID=UPI002B298C5F|nr:hypothetical protein SMAC4_13336 [Sordaria macrospora]